MIITLTALLLAALPTPAAELKGLCRSAFDVSMGVRKDDLVRRRQIDDWLKADTAKIRTILAEFGIEVVP